jgi:hypothetical protein
MVKISDFNFEIFTKEDEKKNECNCSYEILKCRLVTPFLLVRKQKGCPN